MTPLSLARQTYFAYQAVADTSLKHADGVYPETSLPKAASTRIFVNSARLILLFGRYVESS